MMFPPVRLSELRADVTKKREKFNRSFDQFQAAAIDKTQSLNFVTKHPNLLIGAGLSALPIAFFIGRKLFKLLSPSKTFGFLTTLEWGFKLTRFAAGILGKTFFPVASELAKSFMQAAFKD